MSSVTDTTSPSTVLPVAIEPQGQGGVDSKNINANNIHVTVVLPPQAVGAAPAKKNIAG